MGLCFAARHPLCLGWLDLLMAAPGHTPACRSCLASDRVLLMGCCLAVCDPVLRVRQALPPSPGDSHGVVLRSKVPGWGAALLQGQSRLTLATVREWQSCSGLAG